MSASFAVHSMQPPAVKPARWARTSALAARRGLGLALERAFPEKLGLAESLADPTREHEQQVGEAIQVRERPLADGLVAHEAQDVAFGPAADRPRHVQEGAHPPAPRQDERLERL